MQRTSGLILFNTKKQVQLYNLHLRNLRSEVFDDANIGLPHTLALTNLLGTGPFPTYSRHFLKALLQKAEIVHDELFVLLTNNIFNSTIILSFIGVFISLYLPRCFQCHLLQIYSE